jgi:rhodanese-related sulfurtransferase
MKHFIDLMQDALKDICEIMPWDLEEMMADDPNLLVLDVRETDEFEAMHIKGAMHVPRGILESACEWDYEETEPELVKARDRHVVVVCRSGYRSLMAAYSLHILGYKDVCSLKTGMRGWKDYDQPMVDKDGNDVDLDYADEYFTAKLRPEQVKPADWVDPD